MILVDFLLTLIIEEVFDLVHLEKKVKDKKLGNNLIMVYKV